MPGSTRGSTAVNTAKCVGSRALEQSPEPQAWLRPWAHSPTPAGSVELSVQLVLLTELVGEGDAGEELTPLAADGVEVEEDHQASQQAQEDQLKDDDLAALAIQVEPAEADVGQEGKGEEEATDEA